MKHSIFPGRPLAIMLLVCLACPAFLSAQKHKKAPALSPTELFEKAEKAYYNYDFSEAITLLEQAAKKNPSKNEELADLIDLRLQQATLGRNFLDRVEKLTILDSIAVPKDRFFKSYLLPPSAGFLGERKDAESAVTDYVFSNENGDYRLWAAPDSTGMLTLMESLKLTDGSWSVPDSIGELGDGDAIYPFMMPDGVTYYYAENGENSMGGYDIMVATRDASDGSFLQPQNLGMPYNSPYDDYLLAIDELNGVGWWATDRNQLDDYLTVYLFKVNDLRSNYDADSDDIADLARISDWRATQNPEDDYSELLHTVKNIKPGMSVKKREFSLPMDGGRIYTAYTDFRSRSAATLMRKYVAAEAKFKESEKHLNMMRKDYHDTPSPQLRNEISKFEKSMEQQRDALRRQLSEIYRAERQLK